MIMIMITMVKNVYKAILSLLCNIIHRNDFYLLMYLSKI